MEVNIVVGERSNTQSNDDRAGLRILLFSIFALSGVAGLIYEAVGVDICVSF